MSNERMGLSIAVHAGDVARQDWPVEVRVDAAALAALGGRSDAADLRLEEITQSTGSKRDAIPLQIEPQAGDTTLTFLLAGTTPAGTTRSFRLSPAPDSGDQSSDVAAAPGLVQVTDNVRYQEQESYRIDTPGAVYYYHKLGAGFAAMLDRDGHDWLSYRPGGGSDGKFRGTPNLVYPEGSFHPGGETSTSRLVSNGPLKATIVSETKDGAWACRWDIFPAFARLTVLRIGHPYWFLYEGTPGGKLDEAGDYVVRSPGLRTPASERWDGPIPAPRWIYFGAANLSRVLYFAHHERDGVTDSYWPMEGNMTVFGFGRLKLDSSLEKTPARFTLGFTELTAGEVQEYRAPAVVNAHFQDVTVVVGKLSII